MRVKLLQLPFYLNGRLHAVSVGKLSERMSNFWTVQFLKTESEPNFGFPHIPSLYMPLTNVLLKLSTSYSPSPAQVTQSDLPGQHF